ncbi:MAG: hypothetical protein ACKO1X_06785, partial [Acidimicrobiales bacterium]
LSSGDVRAWLDDDVALRRRLMLPPFTEVAVLGFDEPPSPASLPLIDGIDTSVEGKEVLVRSTDSPSLGVFVALVRSTAKGRVRVAVNPPRF